MSYSKEQFDEVVYATGYVQLIQACSSPGSDYGWVHTVQLDGEFTPEALSMINHAIENHPEWFKLGD